MITLGPHRWGQGQMFHPSLSLAPSPVPAGRGGELETCGLPSVAKRVIVCRASFWHPGGAEAP